MHVAKITHTSRCRLYTRCMHQCSARAAQNIEGHHRPVIASNFRRLHTDSPSKKSRPKEESFVQLFSRSRSRSLTELTRQITPPTKNGHAPPPTESRKIFNLSILTVSGPGKFSRVESN